MTIVPCILRCTKQAEKVDRLVQYCKELDGTEIKVIPVNPGDDRVPHPIGVELGIRQVAKEMYYEYFMWLEADSIPLKAGWLAAITEEYQRVGKPYLMPDLSATDEWDVASAIAVYPPNYLDILPPVPDRPPWFDLWILDHHPEVIGLTKIIQHRYGVYHGNRVERRHEFPKDTHIIHPDAVIFHADPTQSIIRRGLQQTFYHSGDYGDIIAALPILKQQGGGHLIIGPQHANVAGRVPRVAMTPERYAGIAPLLEQQSYIKSVRYSPNHNEAERDFSTFRFGGWNQKDNLAEWQGRHLGRLELEQLPWIELPEFTWNGRVIVARTHRYHNPEFPWKLIGDKYKDQLLFVGFPDEHQTMQQIMGRTIERANTANLLDVVRLIAGAKRVFTNQTVIWWIAAGLGKKTVQESWDKELNSIIPRRGFRYTRTPEETNKLCRILQRLP
jgi:hypothetical protein